MINRLLIVRCFKRNSQPPASINSFVDLSLSVVAASFKLLMQLAHSVDDDNDYYEL